MPTKKSTASTQKTKFKPTAKTSNTDIDNPAQVNAYMTALEYPLKAKVQALRKIIHGVNKNITEQIKWNAPSFSYKGYLVTFNLHDPKQVRLIFHNGILLHDDSGLLQGDYPDRRLAYFFNLQEVKAHQPALEKILREWITLMDKAGG